MNKAVVCCLLYNYLVVLVEFIIKYCVEECIKTKNNGCTFCFCSMQVMQLNLFEDKMRAIQFPISIDNTVYSTVNIHLFECKYVHIMMSTEQTNTVCNMYLSLLNYY